mgnify:FL=1
MEIIIQLLSTLLDIYILKSYLTTTLGTRKTYIKGFWFYLSMIVTEILLLINTSLFINSTSFLFTITTNMLSLLTTFTLCFFFESKPLYNVASAIIFQIFVLLSEKTCVILSNLLYDRQVLNGYKYEITMNLMSKIILLLFTIMLSILRKKEKHYPAEYNILMLFTPTTSLFVLIAMPIHNDYISNNLSFFFIIWIYIATINIVHSFLVKKLADSYIAKMHASELEKQINYQKEKYLQLGESYKTGRRIIHDIKHHNEILKRFISEEKYKEMYEYLTNYTDTLENTYIKVNTGNLVIDALVTNYFDLAASADISFAINLKVDNTKIPISNYDLCIILGNLLDNSLHACKTLPQGAAKISLTITTDKTDKFIILIENTYASKDDTSKKKSYENGYGLDNIRNAVEAYHGIITINPSDTYKTLISIPITDINQRYMPPPYPES